MNNKKKKIMILSISILVVLIVVLGLTYAFFQSGILGDSNVIQLADGLNLRLTNEKPIAIENTMPMKDDYALEYIDSYDFSLENESTDNYAYTIGVEHLNENLPVDKLRYSIRVNEEEWTEAESLSDFSYEGDISGNTIQNFKLKLWIDKDAGNEVLEKTYSGKINISTEEVSHVVYGRAKDGLANLQTMSDEEGSKMQPYTVRVENTSGSEINYTVKIEEPVNTYTRVRSVNAVTANDIKVSYKKNNESYSTPQTLSSIQGGILEEGKMTTKGEKLTYAIKMWIDETAGEEATYRINVETEIEKPIVVKQVETGINNTYALTNDGKIYAWGYNGNGELGDGTTEDKYVPTLINGIRNVKQVAAGLNYAVALTEDGKVYTWGTNDKGQLGIGTTGGNKTTPILVENLDNVVQIASGYYHIIALTKDGDVYAWGHNASGQLSGSGSKYVPTKVNGLNNVQEIATGRNHTVVLTEDGEIYAWGENAFGQLGDGTITNKNIPTLIEGINNVKELASRYYHTIALTNNGEVYTWGWNYKGGLGDSTTADKHVPTLINGINNVKQIAAGEYHTVAVTNDGEVYAWGSNQYGQLGDGTTEDKHIPMLITGISNIVEVTGWSHTAAITKNGKVYTWGNNESGQLGIGTSGGNKTTPTLIEIK